MSHRHATTPEEIAARHAAEVHAAAELLGAIPEAERNELLQRLCWAGVASPRAPLPVVNLHQSCEEKKP